MNPTRRLALGGLAAGLLCAAAPALAHRFTIGLTEIGFNERTGGIEIVHTYMAHDIEPLLARQAGRAVDLGSAEAEALLRAYMDSRFWLMGPDKVRLPLAWVGMGVNVESVVVYQEAAGATLDKVAHIHQEILADLLPRQSNTVNVRIDGEIRSLAFDATTVERRLR